MRPMETAFIKDTIQYFIDKLGVKAELVDIAPLHGGEITAFSIKTEEPQLLIGFDGKTLMALNHLIKKIYEQESLKKGFSSMNFIVDVNGFQKEKIEAIKNKAHMMAERARFFKNDVEMLPMNPYERMIIHSLFTNIEDIETESMGQGRERRVVIKYIEDVVKI